MLRWLQGLRISRGRGPRCGAPRLCFSAKNLLQHPVQAEAPPQAGEEVTAHSTSSAPHRPPPVELGRQRSPKKPSTTRTTTITPMIQKILFILSPILWEVVALDLHGRR